MIFIDDADRQRFVETLGEACAKTGWQVHAYVLMPNHFHLVVETPQANLVAGMKWFLGTYTSRFNRRHRLFGHLFSGRYKSLIVEGSGNGYLRTVCDYVPLNPVRARLLTPEQPLRDYRWSSYGECLKAPGRRPGWLRVDSRFGIGMGRDGPPTGHGGGPAAICNDDGGTAAARRAGRVAGDPARVVSGRGTVPVPIPNRERT